MNYYTGQFFDLKSVAESLEKLESLKAPQSMIERIRAKLAFENGDWQTLTKMVRARTFMNGLRELLGAGDGSA